MGLYDRYLALRIRAADAEPPAHVALVITERDLLERGAYESLERFLDWAFAYGATRVAVYVSVLDPEAIDPLRRGLASIDAPAAVEVHGPTGSAAGPDEPRAETGPAATAEAGSGGSAESALDVGSESVDGATPESADGAPSRPATGSPAGDTSGGSGGLTGGSPAAGDGPGTDAPIQISVGLGGKHEFTEAVRALAERAAAGDLDPEDLDEDDVEAELVLPAEPDLVIKTGAERLSDFMIWQSVYSELYFTDVNWRDLRKRDYLRAIREYIDRTRRFGQ